MFRWTGSVGALVVALALALVAPAGAATGFLTDETLTSDAAGAFDVAMAPNGYAIVGWVEGASRAQVVRVSTRPPGGDWWRRSRSRSASTRRSPSVSRSPPAARRR
jgi:hypothetical protein